MKLQQGQIWKEGETYFRIVRLARLEVEYKAYPGLQELARKGGKNQQVTKKEFCRLVKRATLFVPSGISADPVQ